MSRCASHLKLCSEGKSLTSPKTLTFITRKYVYVHVVLFRTSYIGRKFLYVWLNRSYQYYCNFTNFRCVHISVASDDRERSVSFKFRCPWMLSLSLNVFFAFRRLFNFPLTTENTENKTAPHKQQQQQQPKKKLHRKFAKLQQPEMTVLLGKVHNLWIQTSQVRKPRRSASGWCHAESNLQADACACMSRV